MQPLHSSYHWQMKAMKVVPMKTYQHPYTKMLCIHHVSSIEHASFDPAHSTPHRPVTSASDLTHSPARPVCCHLSFSSDCNPMDTSNSSRDTTPESSDIEDENFLTLPMDDEHWTTELAPERTLCIHKNGYPTIFAHTPAHTDLITLYHILTVWIEWCLRFRRSLPYHQWWRRIARTRRGTILSIELLLNYGIAWTFTYIIYYIVSHLNNQLPCGSKC